MKLSMISALLALGPATQVWAGPPTCAERLLKQTLREKAANIHLKKMLKLEKWMGRFQSFSRTPTSALDFQMIELRAFIQQQIRLGSYEAIYQRMKGTVKAVFSAYQRTLDNEALIKKYGVELERLSRTRQPAAARLETILDYGRQLDVPSSRGTGPATKERAIAVLNEVVAQLVKDNDMYASQFARAIDPYVAAHASLQGIFLENAAATSAKTLSEMKAILRRTGIHQIDDNVDVTKLSAEARLAYELLQKFRLERVLDDYYISIGQAMPTKTPSPYELLQFLDERPVIDYRRLQYATVWQGLTTAQSWLPTEVLQSSIDRILRRIPWVDHSRVRKVFRVALDRQMRVLYFADIERIATSAAPMLEKLQSLIIASQGTGGDFLLTFARRVDVEVEWRALKTEAERMASTSQGAEKDRYARFVAEMTRAEQEAAKLDSMALYADAGRYNFVARLTEAAAASAVLYGAHAFATREGGALDRMNGALKDKTPEELRAMRDALMNEEKDHAKELEEVQKILDELESDSRVRAELESVR
jgi:hypothetical protein